MTDEAINSIFMFVQKKWGERPELCRRKFTTGNLCVTNFLRREDGLYKEMSSDVHPRDLTYGWSNAGNVLKYEMGELADHNIPWSTVDTVYMSYNIGGLHWVLVCIDLEVGEVVVSDSMVVLNKDEVVKELRVLCQTLPILLWKIEVMNVRKDLSVER